MRYSALRDRDQNRIAAYQFIYDVTKRLRDQQRLPVVLVTAYADGAASMLDGEFGLLLKPYTLETLAEAMTAGLEQRSRQ